jgi:beta-galactosidase/beta-glucuronidase
MDFRVWIIGLFLVTVLQFFNISPPSLPKELFLKNSWLFKKGDSITWSQPNFEDNDWQTITVPATWESQGHTNYDGVAWYRVHIYIPREWKQEKSFVLDLGKIDDEDTTYFNGRIIGSTKGCEIERKYAIPPSIINFGKDNVIAVRVVDTGGDGGIYQGRLKLYSGTIGIFDVEKY